MKCFKSFTTFYGSDIISYMKASKALKLTLAAAIAVCTVPLSAVFAAENVTYYPVETTDEGGNTVKPFEREPEIVNVTDYAVGGDDFFAFATNSTIKIISRDKISGDKSCTSYTHDYTIKKLDYVNGENGGEGKLYFQNSYDVSYLYGSPVVPQEHEFQSVDSSLPIIVDSTSYYTLNGKNGELQYWKDSEPTVVGNGFSLIKKYGNYVYAIKDGSKPYKIDGSNASGLDLSYTDFSGADNILCGDTASKLKGEGYRIKTANIKSGNYYTQINADYIGEAADKFIQIRTQKADGDKPCIVLCESGNATVVATNDGMFITATENLGKSDYPAQKNDWPINEEGKRLSAYAVEDTGVYAYPYMCKSTRIATLKSGAANHVEVIERFDFSDVKFYRIRYETKTVDESTGTENTSTVTGFVAANMLTEYDFKGDDNKPGEGGDTEFKYETNVVSVVIAIVIVALVIIAIMYIALIGTKKDKQKKVKKAKDKSLSSRTENDEDYEE